MAPSQRRNQLAEIIRSQGFATLLDLTTQMGVSESTIRRDLNALEVEGKVKRTHGGVLYIGRENKAPHFAGLEPSNLNHKRSIARAAAGLVAPGESVVLDGGTTTFELATLLLGRGIHVITNSLPVANLFSTDETSELIFVGGVVQQKTGVAIGNHTVNMLKSIRARKTFISSAGITDDGLFNQNLLLVEAEQAMISCADQTILLADSTKFGQTSIAKVCELNAINRAVVDAKLLPHWNNVLQSNSVELINAPAEMV